ncbi:MAG: zinc ABC transporter substrate-binding protein [Candidatus Magnetoovum sp. WYHC-5]|nr:zinc ABC transporter substrate-binding protein [Candidatus Magnetoovum sp. WYHC-5]
MKRWLVVFLVLLLSSCSDKPNMERQAKTLNVLATTSIVGDLVKSVGGEAVNVTVLMGAGVDPHLYKASAGDINRMYEASLIFYSGLHLEGKMADVLEKLSSRVKTYAVTDGIDKKVLLRPAEFEGNYDPHVWFDVKLWAGTVEYVSNVLCEIDPANATLYKKNATLYVERLNTLDEYVKTKTKELPTERRVLITAHDAFNYFGKAYGYEVKGLQGISTVAEAGTADVQGLADFITERKIPAIFVETSVPTRFVEALQEAVKARGFGVKIGGSLYSDALGTPGSTADTYETMIRYNIDTIVKALSHGN